MKRLLALIICACVCSGCMLMPKSLQPHQLQKLNRQPPSSHEDAFFSIEDRPRPTSESFSCGEPKSACGSVCEAAR